MLEIPKLEPISSLKALPPLSQASALTINSQNHYLSDWW